MTRKSKKLVVTDLVPTFGMYRAIVYMRLLVMTINTSSDSIEKQLPIIENFILLQDDIYLENY